MGGYQLTACRQQAMQPLHSVESTIMASRTTTAQASSVQGSGSVCVSAPCDLEIPWEGGSKGG